MIVFSEFSPPLRPSASTADLRKATEAAKLTGCQVYHIPQDFEQCETADNALAHVHVQERETLAVWIGYIPTPERYAAIYAAAQEKHIRLLNSPEEHLNAQEFDRTYPLLEGLTPTSLIVTSVDQCAEAAGQLGLPVFVKGAVQSRKSRGWKACVAETADELRVLCGHLLELDNRSRGRVVVRQLVNLKHSRTSAEGFPLGREYRVFLHRSEVVGWGYYWEWDDPLKALAPDEEQAVLTLATEAARRVGTPYIAVDIGQTESGKWIVIETGDAQFSGVSQTPLLPLWSRLARVNAGA